MREVVGLFRMLVLRGLVDVANTPLYEPTTSLHDDGLPFDRGK